MRVLIVTSSHWEGDPRLNRHVRYLTAGGFEAELAVATSASKFGSLFKGVRLIIRSDADVVFLPDPELFVLGSLIARATGKKVVVDIHEDYPKTAAERPWIPDPLRPVVAVIAALVMTLGRMLAWRVIVAAPQLARRRDVVVTNVPDPDDFEMESGSTRNQIVYVGEVFPARGTTEMVRLLAQIPVEVRLLAIGKVSDETRQAMLGFAKQLGVADRLELTGRLGHSEAWSRSRDSIAGLALLQPAPAYVDAVATKIWEYMAAGIPPVVSDLPGQAAVVKRIHPDLVCASLEEAAAVITRLASNSGFRTDLVGKARALVEEEWERSRPDLALQRAVSP